MRYLKCLLALAWFTTLTAPVIGQATDSLLVSVTPIEVKTIELKVENLQRKATQITIQKLDGSVTYFTDFTKKKANYARKINLKELADGKYLLVITQGNQKKQQVIVMKEGRGMLLSDVK